METIILILVAMVLFLGYRLYILERDFNNLSMFVVQLSKAISKKIPGIIDVKEEEYE